MEREGEGERKGTDYLLKKWFDFSMVKPLKICTHTLLPKSVLQYVGVCR